MTEQNRQIRLARRPVGLTDAETWEHVSGPLPAPAEGEVLVRTLYLSIDPAMRGWLNEGRSYLPPVQIGEVMRALGIGQVIAGEANGFKPGDLVSGMLGWQQFCACKARGLNPVDPDLAPPVQWLSALGMTGMTAYFGLLDVGRPAAGETVLVSAAAGAVGSIVGQIARLKGARAVGIAGGPEKCELVRDTFGFDACIDYKSGESLNRAVRDACPDGVHVYFDNVGGDLLDAALRRLARGARVVLCGAISTYNDTAPSPGPAHYMSLLVNRARMEGFIVFDYADRYAEAQREIAGWLRDGRLVSREHIVEGLAAAPEALNMLFKGENQGKLIVRVGTEA